MTSVLIVVGKMVSMILITEVGESYKLGKFVKLGFVAARQHLCYAAPGNRLRTSEPDMHDVV